MKKYFKLSLFVLTLFLSVNLVSAQDDGWDGPETPPGINEGENEGDGGTTTPINNYIPTLIITGIAIAGAYSYKQRKTIQL